MIGNRKSVLFNGEELERDSTFGFTSRFFNKRAIFKKMSSNKSGSFGFPKAESDALDLKHKSPVNIVAIKLDRNSIATVSNVQVSKNKDGFFVFNLPDSVGEQLGGYTMDMIAPLQFIVSKVGIDEPNPINQISPLGMRNSYTSSRFLVYKSGVSKDEGGHYVTIERNERDFFGVSEGDTLSIGTMPLKTSGMTTPISKFFNNSTNATVHSATDNEDTTSLKIYLNNLPGMFGYDQGDLVQVFGLKL